jgi:hypothetical protein
MSPKNDQCADLETLGRQVVSGLWAENPQFLLVSYINPCCQKKDCSACNLVHADFLSGLLFDCEDGVIVFLQNIT